MADKCSLTSVYTAKTIAFVNSNPDTITDSANGLLAAGIAAGVPIAITGSVSNNKTVTAAAVTAGTITLIGTDELTEESAGNIVTLTTAVQFSPIVSDPPLQKYDYGNVVLVSKITGTRWEYSNFKKFYDEVTLNNESKAHALQYEAWREYQVPLTYNPNTDEGTTYTVNIINESVPLEMRPETLWDTVFEGTLKLRETTSDILDSFTKLQVKFDVDFSDSSFYNHVPAVYGAAISTEKSRFGAGSGYFQDDSKYVMYAVGNDCDLLDQDFTLERWIYFGTMPVNGVQMSMYTQYNEYGSSIKVFVDKDSNYAYIGFRAICSEVEKGYIIGKFAVNWSTGTWYHIAVCRDGANLLIFLDGIEADSYMVTTPLGYIFHVSSFAYLGSFNLAHSYMDEVRISVGVCRYTEHFTPQKLGKLAGKGYGRLYGAYIRHFKYLGGIMDRITEILKRIQDQSYDRTEPNNAEPEGQIIEICLGCGQSFHRYHGKRVFCSERCSNRHRQKLFRQRHNNVDMK